MRFTQLLTSCLLLILLGVPGVAMSLDFSAFWLYRTSGGDGRDTRSEFQERYSLGVGPQLDWRPTHAITASAAVGYNRTQQDTGSGTRTADQITPSASLNLNNDIFSLGLAGSASQSSGSDREKSNTNSWDATLASRWNLPYWPNIRLNYGQRDESGDSDSLFSRSDQIQTSGNATVNWDLRLAQFDYRYSDTLDENRSTGDSTDSNSHFVRGQTGGSLLNNRVRFQLSQQYQRSDSTRLSFGELSLGRWIPEIWVTGAPNVPALGDPLVYFPFEIAGFEQQVDVIRLSYDADQLARPEKVPLRWDLYEFVGGTGEDWFDWNLIDTLNGTIVEDAGYVELPINLDLNRRKLLLVSRVTPIQPPFNPEVAIAYRLLDQDGTDPLTRIDSMNTSLLTNGGLNVSLTQTLRASANASFEQIDGESTSISTTTDEEDQIAESERESQRRTLGGRLAWTPYHWLSPSVGFSETTEKGEDTREGSTQEDLEQEGLAQAQESRSRNDTERVNRSYSLTIATRPLSTVSMTFGVTKTETTADDVNSSPSALLTRNREGDGMRYSVTTSAQLYPDLSTSLFIGYSEQEDRVFEVRVGQDGSSETSQKLAESETFSIRSNFNARLRTDLTADLTTNFSNRKRWSLEQIDGENKEDFPKETESNTADSSLILSYRPSSFLSLQGFYTAYFLDNTQDNRMGAGLVLALLRTSKTRVTLNYNFVYVTEMTHSLGLNGSWNISRALSLQGRTNYSMSDTNFYSAQVSLNLRL